MGADDHALMKLSPIVDKLLQRGYRFSFFQAVYILEKVYGDSVPPGVEGPLSQEMIRFRARPRLSFPATSICHIEKIADRNLQMSARNPETIQMILSFMGLYGVNSPLPQYFSEVIISGSEEISEDSEEDDGGALRKFLDIFDHRIYSFFYRSWKKYKYHLQFESGAKDRFSKYMLSFFGLGTPALPDLAGIAADKLIPYAGILGQQSRCTASLQRMISDHFGG
ncbi:type VI secretion system baseplate subunit TssG, partial [Candidatus Poribacteria bacterium]